MSVYESVTNDESGAYRLSLSFGTSLLSHITASGTVHAMADVVRLAFSVATALVSILVGVSGLIKFWCWWLDRRSAQRREQRMVDGLNGEINRLNGQIRNDEFQRLVSDMKTELSGDAVA